MGLRHWNMGLGVGLVDIGSGLRFGDMGLGLAFVACTLYRFVIGFEGIDLAVGLEIMFQYRFEGH